MCIFAATFKVERLFFECFIYFVHVQMFMYRYFIFSIYFLLQVLEVILNTFFVTFLEIRGSDFEVYKMSIAVKYFAPLLDLLNSNTFYKNYLLGKIS